MTNSFYPQGRVNSKRLKKEGEGKGGGASPKCSQRDPPPFSPCPSHFPFGAEKATEAAPSWPRPFPLQSSRGETLDEAARRRTNGSRSRLTRKASLGRREGCVASFPGPGLQEQRLGKARTRPCPGETGPLEGLICTGIKVYSFTFFFFFFCILKCLFLLPFIPFHPLLYFPPFSLPSSQSPASASFLGAPSRRSGSLEAARVGSRMTQAACAAAARPPRSRRRIGRE